MRGPTGAAIVGVALAIAAAIGAGAALERGDGGGEGPQAGEASAVSISATSSPPSSALEALELRLHAVPGTRRTMGALELAHGRTIRLHTVETARGETCLIDEDASLGLGSTCLENGLFARRRAAFSVNSNGGPGRLRELQLVGLAAPDVGSIVLIRSDGSRSELALGRHNAFVYESAVAELERGAVPSGLAVYSRSERHLETIEIPGAG